MEYKCKYCGKIFDKSYSLAGHTSHCRSNPKFNEESYNKRNKENSRKSFESFTLNKLKKIEEGNIDYINRFVLKTFICKCPKCNNDFEIKCTQHQFDKGDHKIYCSRECANSHIVSDKTKKNISNGVNNWVKNNQEKIKETYKTYYCKECGKPFTMFDERNCKGRIYCSKECKHNYLSRHTGGYRKGSGHGHSGWYKGIYCDSSWELAYVIYCKDHNIDIQRCKEHRKYEYKGKTLIYIPDFIVNNQIIEIKGYITEQWKAKIKNFDDIKVLYKDEITPYLNYVINTYGEDYYLRMYENKNTE